MEKLVLIYKAKPEHIHVLNKGNILKHTISVLNTGELVCPTHTS